MILCLGDSHVSIFQGVDGMINRVFPEEANYIKSPYFVPSKIYELGIVVNNIEKHLTNIKGVINKYNLNPEKDYLMFCMGEVDCRSHIQKQSDKQKKNVEDIVQEVIDKYVENLKEFECYNLIFCGPICQSPWTEHGDPYYKTYGSWEQRNYIAKTFNEMLEKKCSEKSYTFVTAFYDMMKPDGNVRDDMFLEEKGVANVHGNLKVLEVIERQLKEKGIINEN